MRVFKHSTDIKQKIAREMVNIESGLLYFEPGKEISTKPTLYPEIERDNIKSTIRSPVGFIYLPNDINMAEFMKGIETYLVDYDMQLNHLSKYMRLKQINSQFTALKAKNNMTKTVYCTSNASADTYTKRVIYLNVGAPISGLYRFQWYVFSTRTMVKNIEQFENPIFPATTQFVSILYDKHDYLKVIDGQKLVSNITFQNFRVFQNLITFDPLRVITDKELALKNNSNDSNDDEDMNDEVAQAHINALRCPKCLKKYASKPGLTRHMNTKSCKKVVHSDNVSSSGGDDNDSPSPPQQSPLPGISSGEPLTSLLPSAIATPVSAVATATPKTCPFCNRSFKTVGSLKTHMKKCKNATTETQSLAKATIQKDNLAEFMKMSPEDKQKHLDKMGGYPEYVPQWNDVIYDPMHGIALCARRGAVFELIRHFGRWDKYHNAFNNGVIALHKLVKPLFYEEFHNIIIENRGIPKTRKTQFPNTAAYADCEICYSCYTPLYGDIYVICNDLGNGVPGGTGTAVCPTCMHYEPYAHSPTKPTQQLLRVAYPTTAQRLISKTNFAPLKKEILLLCFGETYTDMSYGSHCAFYLGNKTQAEYLGWTGFLSDFISYIDSNNNFSHLTNQPMMKYLEKTKIFPARLIRF